MVGCWDFYLLRTYSAEAALRRLGWDDGIWDPLLWKPWHAASQLAPWLSDLLCDCMCPWDAVTKLPQTGRLNTTEIYSITVLGARVQNRISRVTPPWSLWRGIIPCFLQFLVAIGISCGWITPISASTFTSPSPVCASLEFKGHPDTILRSLI